MSALPLSEIEQELTRYNQWRRELLHAIAEYQDWLEKTEQMDVAHSLRFYELTESINKGRLTIAFVAEFSRGKSELINALFFADYKQRLLPSDIGRTTMCPTEIFHDPEEEPCIRLLPIESRYRSESIAQLKNMPVEWVKIRLNLSSVSDMKGALQTLAESKKIFALEAKMMGLNDDPNVGQGGAAEMQTVEVPAWRYALINIPHPLLTQGVSIVDTPGLNALGLEPELTLNTIPNAHAVVFLLGIDTGVTRSDMEVWQKYVPNSVSHRLALLNKIDLLWDDLKSHEEVESAIQRQVENTAHLLSLPTRNVLPISAQKALLGRVRNEPEMVERSGVTKLEGIMAKDIIPLRRKIVARSVVAEIGAMMVNSRKGIYGRIAANADGVKEVAQLAGKSRGVLQKLWEQINANRARYMNAVAEYKIKRQEFTTKRELLLEMVNPAKLEFLLQKSAEAIDNTWTTVGLTRGMNALFSMLSQEFERIYNLSEEIKLQMQSMYDFFHREHAFPALTIPTLELEAQKLRLQLLVAETEKFCKDPVNIMAREKHWVIPRFHRELVAHARKLFDDARQKTESWLRSVTLPLEAQIKDHKSQIEERLANLTKIQENQAALKERLDSLKLKGTELEIQRDMIDKLITTLQTTGPQ